MGWREMMPTILREFSANEVYSKRQDFIGMFGPVFTLRRSGKQRLPKAELLRYCKNRIESKGIGNSNFAEEDEERYKAMTTDVWSTLFTHYCFLYKL